MRQSYVLTNSVNAVLNTENCIAKKTLPEVYEIVSTINRCGNYEHVSTPRMTTLSLQSQMCGQ